MSATASPDVAATRDMHAAFAAATVADRHVLLESAAHGDDTVKIIAERLNAGDLVVAR